MVFFSKACLKSVNPLPIRWPVGPNQDQGPKVNPQAQPIDWYRY